MSCTRQVQLTHHSLPLLTQSATTSCPRPDSETTSCPQQVQLTHHHHRHHVHSFTRSLTFPPHSLTSPSSLAPVRSRSNQIQRFVPVPRRKKKKSGSKEQRPTPVPFSKQQPPASVKKKMFTINDRVSAFWVEDQQWFPAKVLARRTLKNGTIKYRVCVSVCVRACVCVCVYRILSPTLITYIVETGLIRRRVQKIAKIFNGEDAYGSRRWWW